MLKKLNAYLRSWLGVEILERENAELKHRLAEQSKRLDRRIAELDKLTAMDADIGFRGPCTIILTGVYRGKGFVTFYEVSVEEFAHMVERYRWEKKEHLIRNVDAPRDFIGSFKL